MKRLLKHIATFCENIRRGYNKFVRPAFYKSRLGYCGSNVNYRSTTHFPTQLLSRVFLYDNTTLNDFRFISAGGRFIMKKGAGAASGLSVITGNHQRVKGVFLFSVSSEHHHDIEKDIIIEEDAWIAANVTLLSGVVVGRGATVGAGSVCIKSIPPYAIVMGNPAKVIGFTFTPEEVVEHEKTLYAEKDRLPLDLLEKNYKRYYLDRLSEIKNIIRI